MPDGVRFAAPEDTGAPPRAGAARRGKLCERTATPGERRSAHQNRQTEARPHAPRAAAPPRRHRHGQRDVRAARRAVAPHPLQRAEASPQHRRPRAAGLGRPEPPRARRLRAGRPAAGRDRASRPRRRERRDRLRGRRRAPAPRHRIRAHRGADRGCPRGRDHRDHRPRGERQPRRARSPAPDPERARRPLRRPRALDPRGAAAEPDRRSHASLRCQSCRLSSAA